MMKLFKKSAVELAGYNPYSELVFGGWDYNIANKQSAILKSKSILKVTIHSCFSDSSYPPSPLQSVKDKESNINTLIVDPCLNLFVIG